jgi:hypothetical protein
VVLRRRLRRGLGAARSKEKPVGQGPGAGAAEETEAVAGGGFPSRGETTTSASKGETEGTEGGFRVRGEVAGGESPKVDERLRKTTDTAEAGGLFVVEEGSKADEESY